MKITESDEKIVEQCRDRLLEHFDSVRIFVTRHSGDSEETAAYSLGGGNFYAQLGQVKEWKTNQDEFVRDNARKDAAEE